MNNLLDRIRLRVDKLISLRLNPGVQPSDFVENVFDDVYQSMKIVRDEHSVAMRVTLFDGTEYRYTYDHGRRLHRIEECVDGVTAVIWDRAENELTAVKSIIRLLDKLGTDHARSFVSSLPADLRETIRQHEKLAA